MVKKLFYAGLALLLLQAPAAFAAQQGGLSKQDKKFFKDAASGGLMEVELGKIAQEKAQSPEVKQFAQRMVQNHSQAEQQLQQVAEQNGLQMPQQLDKKDQKKIDDLNKYSGVEFDKKYMHAMVKDHEKDISEFKKEAKSGKNPALQQFASATLPTLQSHLQEAKQVNKAVGSEKSSQTRRQSAPTTNSYSGSGERSTGRVK